jgi:hypothetical protein
MAHRVIGGNDVERQTLKRMGRDNRTTPMRYRSPKPATGVDEPADFYGAVKLAALVLFAGGSASAFMMGWPVLGSFWAMACLAALASQ